MYLLNSRRAQSGPAPWPRYKVMSQAQASQGASDDDDPVVFRIPVRRVASEAARDASVCLLQYPLRPRWRPYDMSRLKTVCLPFEPHARESVCGDGPVPAAG